MKFQITGGCLRDSARHGWSLTCLNDEIQELQEHREQSITAQGEDFEGRRQLKVKSQAQSWNFLINLPSVGIFGLLNDP